MVWCGVVWCVFVCLVKHGIALVGSRTRAPKKRTNRQTGRQTEKDWRRMTPLGVTRSSGGAA